MKPYQTLQPELRELTITILLPPKELSPNARCHWAKKAKAVKRYRELAHGCTLEALAGRRKPRWKSAEVVIRGYFPTARKPDADNFLAALKAAFDGIVDAGVLVDDNGLFLTIEPLQVDRERPRVELVISRA